MLWTEEEIALLIKLWSDGKSNQEIANALKIQFGREFTRNACAGKVHRLTKHGVLPRRMEYLPRKQVLKPDEHKPRLRKPSVAPVAPPAPVMQEPPVSEETISNIVMFRDRRQNVVVPPYHPNVPLELATGCLYATIETPEGIHLFCNAKKKNGSVYCAHHHSVCNVPAPLRDPKEKFRLVKK